MVLKKDMVYNDLVEKHRERPVSDFEQPVEQRVIMNGISPVSSDEKQCQGDRQEDRILNLNEFNCYLKCFYHLRLVNKMML